MPLSDQPERIAIVGVGGIFPGAPDLDTFWKNIAEGIDCGKHVPNGRWYLSPEKAYAPWPTQPDRVYSTWGCFIEGFQLDPTGLNIDPELLSRLDPMFHLGLHAARAAFRDARQLEDIDLSRVGVILGNIALPTESTSAICRDVLGRTFVEKLIDATPLPVKRRSELKATLKQSDWHPLNRYAAGLPSSLIAQGLGLGGIAFTLDAACASSLYSLKFASEELLAHRADAMLAGGMSRPDCQYTQMGFAQLQALSKSGRCAPLSGEADGLVVGEGAGVFVLKRLSDAVAAGDYIYGVIAGIGLSNDRGANLLAPHSEGQLRAMRSAYEQAGWQPNDVDLIECHATGTPVGDAVEIESLHQLWQHKSVKPRQCVIGGVKSNVGHLLTGAGAAGLMKVLFAMKHRTLPPTANYKQPAARLAANDSPFRVLPEAQPWPERIEGRGLAVDGQQASGSHIPRRATINAFGFGGINAHVLIEEWSEEWSDFLVPSPPSSGERARVRRLSGENAHNSSNQIDEERTPHPNPLPSKARGEGTGEETIPIAIVGLDSHVGTWDSKQSVQENDFQGKPLEWTELNWWGVEQSDWFRREGHSNDTGFVPTQPAKPTGRGITEVRLPMGQFRIPPLEMQDMLPQQQLILKVAAGAVRDAQKRDQQPNVASSVETSSPSLGNRTGVFIGIELDPNTTNFHLRWSIEQDAPRWAEMLGLDFTPDELVEWTKQLKNTVGPPLTPNRVMGNLGGIVASRLAREFDVGGPSFTISCGGRSDLVAMELAVRALQRGELDQAIVGGVDLSTDPRCNTFDRPPRAKYDDERTVEERYQLNRLEFRIHDLAEAIVLKRIDVATRDGDRCYVQIVERPGVPYPHRTEQLDAGQFRPHGSSGVAGQLVIDQLSLYHSLNRYLKYGENPAESDWHPGRLARVQFRRKGERRRYRIASWHNQISQSQIFFQEAEAQTGSIVEAERRRPIGELPLGLFVVDGGSTGELLATLDELARMVMGSSRSAESLAVRWFQGRPPKSDQLLAITIVASSSDELVKTIERARDTLRGSASPDEQFSRQVFFSSSPLAKQGRVAFVFPGSGNVFCRMARTLLSVFPEVLRRQEDENADLAAQYRPDLIWPHRLKPLDLDHKTMIFSQVAMGTAICDLLALFGVKPTASIGYSLGESAALFGLRAWTDRDEMLHRMEESPLFGSDLVAPFDAARKAWGVPDGEDVPWLSGVIDRAADEIRAAIASLAPSPQPVFGEENTLGERARVKGPSGEDAVDTSRIPEERRTPHPSPLPSKARGEGTGSEPRVYLLIINTPRQCVIGGDRSQVEQLVRDLNATFVPLAAPSTVHCEVLRQVEAVYRELHLMQTSVPTVADTTQVGHERPIDFYSAAWGHKYDLTLESAAEAIVAQAVGTIDFPRVIEQAYADGVRVFVEIGPGSSCTKMIDEILGDRPHLARAALPNTSRPVETFLELLAALIAEGVPVDLSYLYGDRLTVEGRGLKDSEESSKSPVREIITRVGGLPFEIPSPPNGWKFVEPVAERASFHHLDNAPYDEPQIESSPQSTRGALPTRLSDDSLVIRHTPLSTQHSALVTQYSSLAFDPQPSTLNLFNQLQLMTDHRTQAHETFLRFSARAERLAAEHLAALAQAGTKPQGDVMFHASPSPVPSPPTSGERGQGIREESLLLPPSALRSRLTPPRSLDRDECLTFAIGKIGDVLGTMFADIDEHPTRVRLPDEPLMLVDRILSIEGEPLSMTSGRVVTEHDIHPGAWYLDCGRIPTCIAVESGQADLFLSGWLGIDFETKGLASYRLLDAVVTFHDELPQAGKTINYDIRVLHFFRQGDTYLFRFEFDATVDGRPLLTMREGCAGFFTQAELAGGKGIIHTALDKRPRPGKRPSDWSDPVPMAVESYDDSQLLALRRGDLASCFGPAFVGLPLREAVTIPGLMISDVVRRGSPAPAQTADRRSPPPSRATHDEETYSPAFRRGRETRAEHTPPAEQRSRMWLIDRVLKLDPVGGKFGMGTILGELDIHPDDWFLTCHFCDDRVMPGTLMYECCMHTLRIFLLRMGWIGEDGQIAYQPIPEVRSRLKCRGQILSSTKKVWYEVTLKEVGYGPDAYCLADALMYADGKPIVEITDMSVRLTELSRETVERLWSYSGPLSRPASGGEGEFHTAPNVVLPSEAKTELTRPATWNQPSLTIGPLTLALSPEDGGEGTTAAAPRAFDERPPSLGFNPQPSTINPAYDVRPTIFNTDRITAFAIGKPSEAFGDRYRVFDDERKIARLPGPPFQFLDRVVSIENCQPWKLEEGGEIVAQYDIPVEAWYFAANRQPTMPFAILLETALQPCGWLAGYLGSALTSETDLSFRNLGGKAIQYREVTPQSGTLTTKVKITKVSQSGGMIIQNFDYHLSCNGEPVYVGDTYFGFFSKESLAHQVGIRDAKVFVPSPEESSLVSRFDTPDAAPFANADYMMVDDAELLLDGGPHGLGFVRGTMRVDPNTWFFKAHFFEDPVVPGSLGLESFFQLMKFYAAARWRLGADARFQTPSQQLDAKTSKPVPHEWVYRGQVVPRDELVTVTAVIREVDDATRQLTAEGFLSVDSRVIYQMKSFTMAVS